MYSDCRVQIVVRFSHDSRGGRARRQATNIDALSINQIIIHDLAGDARDKRGLAPAALLATLPNRPVPTGGAFSSALRLLFDRSHTAGVRKLMFR